MFSLTIKTFRVSNDIDSLCPRALTDRFWQVMKLMTDWVSVCNDFTDMTLVSKDTFGSGDEDEVEDDKSWIVKCFHAIRGAIKRKKTGFFWTLSEMGGRGSRRIQNFLNRKNSDFFGLFGRKGGGSHPIQKGFSRKLGKISKKSHFFWIFCRKLEFFWTFFRNGGGGLAQSKIFLNRKFLGVQIDRGGVSLVRTMLKKNSFSYLIAPLMEQNSLMCRWWLFLTGWTLSFMATILIKLSINWPHIPIILI